MTDAYIEKFTFIKNVIHSCETEEQLLSVVQWLPNIRCDLDDFHSHRNSISEQFNQIKRARTNKLIARLANVTKKLSERITKLETEVAAKEMIKEIE